MSAFTPDVIAKNLAICELAEQGPMILRHAIIGDDIGVYGPESRGVLAEFYAEYVKRGDVRPAMAQANAHLYQAACDPQTGYQATLLALQDALKELDKLRRENERLSGEYSAEDLLRDGLGNKAYEALFATPENGWDPCEIEERMEHTRSEEC